MWHLAGKPAFAFAGLMSRYTVDGESRLSASIITREAEGPAADVHARMPVILPHEAEGTWMDRELKDGAKALEIAQAASVTNVEFYAVSSRVNNSRNSGAELIEPFANPA